MSIFSSREKPNNEFYFLYVFRMDNLFCRKIGTPVWKFNYRSFIRIGMRTGNLVKVKINN